MCHLGREPARDELVHHINGDSLDNRVENLEITTAQAHSEHHNRRWPVEKPCDVCGVVYRPHPTKRARSRTCSEQCKLVLLSSCAKKAASDEQVRERRRQAAYRNGAAERGKTLVLHRWHPELFSDK